MTRAEAQAGGCVAQLWADITQLQGSGVGSWQVTGNELGWEVRARQRSREPQKVLE